MNVPLNYSAWLTINRSCNLRCAWCYAKGTGFERDDMSMQTVDNSIRLFKDLNVRTVFLIGGEPTIHPDFFQIVRALTAAEIRPMLISNSVVFHDREFLEETVRAGVCGITTSLKGASAEQYQKFTGAKSFDKVIQGIQNIESLRLNTPLIHRVSVTVCRELFTSFGELLEAVQKSGASELSIDTERPIFLNGKAQPIEGTTPKEMAKLLVDAYPLLCEFGLKFFVRLSLPFCLFPQEFLENLKQRGQLLSGCQLIRGNGIIVDPNGSILPCNHFCDHPIGKIAREYTGQNYKIFRKQPSVLGFYQAMANCPDKRCQNCSWWSSCGGGCRVHWFASGANTLLPEGS
jgi:radical SAM protein with 4Fe4S-binding SPASM domain